MADGTRPDQILVPANTSVVTSSQSRSSVVQREADALTIGEVGEIALVLLLAGEPWGLTLRAEAWQKSGYSQGSDRTQLTVVPDGA